MKNKIILIIICICIIASSIVIDQVSKRWAFDELRFKSEVQVWDNYIVLTYVENTGAFLGMGADWPFFLKLPLFIILPVVAIGATIIYIFKGKDMNWIAAISLSFISGGGIGNLIDRIGRDGHVIDFMNIGIGSVRSGIFNVADLAIVIGSVLLLLFLAFEGKGKKTEKTKQE